MKAIITGANGFIGRELVKKLADSAGNELCLFDASFPKGFSPDLSNISVINGDLADSRARKQLLDRDFDVLFHLAALPGGAAEADPNLSKRINLDATLALFEEAASVTNCPRIVYSSTIAVLPSPMPTMVNDNCPLVPELTYGTHKAMVELALADMSRRGMIDSVAIRLPGIVARPPVENGLKTAFISNVFHALKASSHFVSPVSQNATMWLMSVSQCAVNLIHAARMDASGMPRNRCVTLPVIRASMAELAETIASEVNQPTSLVSYKPDLELEAIFGTQSPIKADAAERVGFEHDGTLKKMVQRALSAC